MIEIIFAIAVSFLIYAYFGYPVSLILLRTFFNKNVKKSPTSPSVTIIITAYNEEERIKDKLENALRLTYPKDKLQIIVVSDCSTDQTEDIVRSYAAKGVELIVAPRRAGKNSAQVMALEKARREIIVFTDAAALLDENALTELVSNFSDPKVGCVSSVDRLIVEGGGLGGENYYLRYEMALRRMESSIGSIVGASGSFFAVRRNLCDNFSDDPSTVSDFKAVLNSVERGLRAVSEPGAIGRYSDVRDRDVEYNRKVRTLVRGMTEFFRHIKLLNPLQYGLFSYEYFCHKLLRWLVPFFLLVTLASNAVLILNGAIFTLLFLVQLLFYGLAVLGWAGKGRNVLLRIPAYFLMTNCAIAIAWWKYLSGERIAQWDPSRR